MKYRINAQFFSLQVVIFCCSLFLSTTFAQQGTQESEKDTYARAVQALNKGSYDNAMNLFNTLLRIRKEKYGSSSVPVANVMNNMGVINSQLGLFDKAITLYEKSLTIYESCGTEELKHLASVYQNLGICYHSKGDIEKSRSYYDGAERIYQKLPTADQTLHESLLINLAQFFLENKNISEAEKYCKKSFEIKPNSLLNFNKLTTSGLICFEKKEYLNSINLFNKAIKVGEKDVGKDFGEKGLIYLNLGMVYLAMEDFENSMPNYTIALDLIGKTYGQHGVSYASCLKDMGLNYLHKRESESNLDEFVLQRKKNILISLDYFQKALHAITPDFTTNELSINPEPEQAIDKICLLGILRTKAEAIYLLSQLDEKKENTEKVVTELKLALATYELSVKTIQLIRNGFQNTESRFFLSSNEHPVYAEAIELAVRLYEKTGDRQFFEKGFAISERSRSADFQSMVQELVAKKISSLPDSLIQKESDLKGEIAAYENLIFNEKSSQSPDTKKMDLWKDKVFSLSQGYQQMIDYVEKKYPRYYQYKYANPIVSVQKIQQSLDRREAFIEYFIREGKKNGAEELYTFVITDHEFRIIRKPLNEEFSETIDHFLKFIRSNQVLKTRKADYLQYAKNANDLYKLLIDPVVSSMQNYRLVIVPDDKLSYLPFDAFLASPADTTRMDFRGLDYLVKHHAISYTYSATLLYFYFQNTLKYSSKVAAFAPDYSDEPLTSSSGTERFLPLPGAEAEVTGLTGLISGDQFTKSRATKQMFLRNAEKYDILHLAMHTILNDTLPLYSKMVFSADSSKREERTLNTYEIYNLKLKSDMVVLSGCNTGSGKLQKGEGVMSLARAFLYAGCPSIIMTLWNVEDASSSDIMIEFYRNIKNGYSKDEALRRAKITYLSQADPLKAHPHYWLGYVSIGKQIPLFKTKIGYFVSLIIFVFLAIVLEKWYFKRKKRTSQHNDKL